MERSRAEKEWTEREREGERESVFDPILTPVTLNMQANQKKKENQTGLPSFPPPPMEGLTDQKLNEEKKKKGDRKINRMDRQTGQEPDLMIERFLSLFLSHGKTGATSLFEENVNKQQTGN